MVTKTRLSAVDRDALERAIKIALASDEPGFAEQIERKLKKDDWMEQQGTSASYGCQRRALQLRPWQSPPSYADAHPGQDGHDQARELLNRLLDAGLSRWEPDPIGALRAIEARRAT